MSPGQGLSVIGQYPGLPQEGYHLFLTFLKAEISGKKDKTDIESLFDLVLDVTVDFSAVSFGFVAGYRIGKLPAGAE